MEYSVQTFPFVLVINFNFGKMTCKEELDANHFKFLTQSGPSADYIAQNYYLIYNVKLHSVVTFESSGKARFSKYH